MGGVVDAIKDAVDKVGDALDKTIEIVGDAVDLAIKTITVPTEILYDTVVKGESFKKSIADGINDLAKDMGDLYESLLDDALGIDDTKFLGLKGDFFSSLGAAIKDFTHDHATSTLGIGIIIAAILVSVFFPPAYGAATAVTVAAVNIGISSTFGILAVWYGTLAIVSLGVSVIMSGLIDAAVLAMYGNSILENIYMYEEAKEILRLTNLAAVLDGSIYDKLAGGWLYNSQFAGNVYYDATQVANTNISVGEEMNISKHLIRTEFGYIDSTLKNLPGDTGFSVLTMTSGPK
ncbi:hypothetical protein [Aliarcobacter butzleri]|uniref:hypothetical protein n=1 Tax=Aliarcobacter butzleri TaxID=28197 RepID=UPI0018671541|nr:hypothetical protein [Aliarcobacter butzleri]